MTDQPKPPAASPPGDLSGMRTLPQDPQSGGPEHRPLQSGELFASRYRVQELLGEGGAGSVYKALDETIDQPIALKVIRAGQAPTPEARKRLVRETIMARNVRHPNVVAVHDAGLAGEQAYMVMELLEGRTLRSWLRQHGAQDTDCAYPVVRALITAILDGIDAAHAQGIVHRDLKPENVFLLSEPGEGGVRLKVLDFGLARTDGAPMGSQTLVGTPHYMAPEQITAPDTAKPSADLYSLSVMFYELLVGVLPQGHWQPPSRGRADVPPQVDQLIEAGLSNRPRSRPQSVAEYRAALLAAATPKPSPQNSAAPNVTREPPPEPPQPTAPPSAPNLTVPELLKQAAASADKARAMIDNKTKGWNIPWDNAHALLKQAVATDDPSAKIAYGRFLHDGLGIHWPAQDEVARTWFNSAASDGSGEAMYWLGQMDRLGRGGPKNPAASIDWFVKSGAAGYAEGDYVAGFAYRGKLGDWGSVTDHAKARYHYERAAKKGHASAMIHLGEMFAEGLGGAKNLATAKDLFERADKAGHPSAADSLKRYGLR
ncbi:MAG: serine/threonine-protein kinase [Hyphomonadaceae bacterium]|nr:serine/threonine-protein kinase [Hyphomonadaceae bacterium]